MMLKCPGAKMSWRPNVLGHKCPGAQMSWCPNVLAPKCPGTQMSWHPNVLAPKCPGAQTTWRPNVLALKCPDAQKSWRPNVLSSELALQKMHTKACVKFQISRSYSFCRFFLSKFNSFRDMIFSTELNLAQVDTNHV